MPADGVEAARYHDVQTFTVSGDAILADGIFSFGPWFLICRCVSRLMGSFNRRYEVVEVAGSSSTSVVTQADIEILNFSKGGSLKNS